MSCINPKQPIFQKILSKTNNPLGSEILYDRLMDILKDDNQYNKYADNLSQDISKDIMLESPALKREADNVYSVHLVKDSNKILTLEQAYKVAEERANKINGLYAKNLKPIARVSNEKGDIRIFIEPNKQHMSDYIINEMIKEEKDKEDYYSGAANIQNTNVKDSNNKKLAGKKAKEFNDTLKNIAKNIGVDVKFIDSIVNKHGMTLNGLFKVTKDLKALIYLSKNSTDNLTLSEELSHAIIDGFENLPVVQNILKQVSKQGYQKFLGDQTAQYEQLYFNNKEMLVKEAAGKALSQALYDNFKKESESILIKAIKSLWNWITNKFSKVSPSMEQDLDSSLDELSMIILGNKLSNKVTYNKATSMASVKDNKKSIRTDKYKEALVNMKRNIGRLKGKLAKTDPNSEEHAKLTTIINDAQSKINSYYDTQNKLYIEKAAEVLLEEINDFINKYENTSELPDPNEFSTITTYLDSLSKGLGVEVSSLISRYNEILKRYVEQFTTEALPSAKDDSYEDIVEDNEDITATNKLFGALVNLKNKLARAIGFQIKDAQIKISSKQGDLYNEVKEQVDKLSKWAKDNGISEKDMYDIFNQEYKGTNIFTREYTTEFYQLLDKYSKTKDWDNFWALAYKDEETNQLVPYDKKKYENSNYKKIQNNKSLKEFYDFYKKTIKEALDRLPENAVKYKGDYFIPNIMMNDLSGVTEAKGFKSKLRELLKYTTGINSTKVMDKDFMKDESLERDIIPIKYLATITSDRKSKDLGQSLFKFAAFTIEHEELNKVLPKTRILQKQIALQKYVSATNSKVIKDGSNTNLYEMVDRVIEMQLKGNKKKDFFKIKTDDIYDENGNVIGKKEIDLADVFDFSLKWNSLLRIGLNPFNSVTNVLVGELGNIIETAGGRFFNTSDLTKASGIFFKEINSKDSKLNYIIEKYPLMQELTDYEYAEKLGLSKGLTGEKLKNYMYKPQKSGEVFLQARTMIAMMLHHKPIEGKDVSFWEMLDEKGNLKKEYQKDMPDFQETMIRFSNKVLAVNEKIHGRYSERDAAIIQQNVLWRMAFQFKKWIPAALEARFESKRYDERLGVDVEGRWRTVYRLFNDFRKNSNRFNELTELERYNLRKTGTELMIILGTLGAYMALGWDDDDKRKKDPLYKYTMSQLDRVSGDMLFILNPENATAMTKNPIAVTKLADDLWDLVKYTPHALYLGEYKYKSGPRKDENKFYSKLGSVIPGVKPAQDLSRVFNDEKYREYNN